MLLADSGVSGWADTRQRPTRCYPPCPLLGAVAGVEGWPAANSVEVEAVPLCDCPEAARLVESVRGITLSPRQQLDLVAARLPGQVHGGLQQRGPNAGSPV